MNEHSTRRAYSWVLNCEVEAELVPLDTRNMQYSHNPFDRYTRLATEAEMYRGAISGTIAELRGEAVHRRNVARRMVVGLQERWYTGGRLILSDGSDGIDGIDGGDSFNTIVLVRHNGGAVKLPRLAYVVDVTAADEARRLAWNEHNNHPTN